MLLLKILGGLVALAIGIWLGLPGSDQPTADDIDKVLDQPGRRRRRVTRHKMPMDWFRSSKRAPDRLSRDRFRVVDPEERQQQEKP